MQQLPRHQNRELTVPDSARGRGERLLQVLQGLLPSRGQCLGVGPGQDDQQEQGKGWIPRRGLVWNV